MTTGVRPGSTPALASCPSLVPVVESGGGRRFQERVMDKNKFAKMLEEYYRLRRLAHELDVQAATVDQRLVEIERQLPDDFVDPNDIRGWPTGD